MTYADILRYNPHLRFVDVYNISSRILEYTNGDTFIVYNILKDKYELHSVSSFFTSDSSYEADIDKEFINGFIYTDYRANELKKFLSEVHSRRDEQHHLYDEFERKRWDLKSQMKTIERTLGTNL